jgi:hypothetical protein
MEPPLAPAPNPTGAAAPPDARQRRAAAYAERTDAVAAEFAAAGGEEGEGWPTADAELLEDLRELDTPAPKKTAVRVSRKRKKREVAAPEDESANAKALRLFFVSEVMEAAAEAAAPFLSPPPALSAKGRAKKLTGDAKRGFQVRSGGRRTPAPRPHASAQTAFQAAIAFLRVRMVTSGTLSTRCAPTQKLRLSGTFDAREHSAREVVHHLAGGIKVYVKGTETCVLVQCTAEEDAQLVRAARTPQRLSLIPPTDCGGLGASPDHLRSSWCRDDSCAEPCLARWRARRPARPRASSNGSAPQ